jgi:hypothetical protein
MLHKTFVMWKTNKQTNKQKQTLWSESASELYRSSDRRLSANLVPTFADRRCHVVKVTDPYDRIFAFLDRSRYVFYQVAPQLYSQSWVDPVPDPLLRKSGSAWNRTRASGSTASNSNQRLTNCISWTLKSDCFPHSPEFETGHVCYVQATSPEDWHQTSA